MSGPNVDDADDSVDEFLERVVAPLREFLDPLISLVTAVLVAVRSSFVSFVVTIGVLFLVASVLLSGHVFPSVNYGILSAMTFIWGVSAIIYATFGKAFLILIGYS